MSLMLFWWEQPCWFEALCSWTPATRKIRQDHLLKGHIYVPVVSLSEPRAIARFCDEFATRVRALPGIIDATVTTVYPPNNDGLKCSISQGIRSRASKIFPRSLASRNFIFLRTLGIP